MLKEAAGAVTESAAEAALQECSENADALSAQGSLKSFFFRIFRIDIVEYLAVVPDFTGNDAAVFEAGDTGFTDFGVVAFSKSS